MRQKGIPFWCHRSKQAFLLVLDLEWSLAHPACSKIENILTKFAAWEHQKYLWSRHLSDFSTGNTKRKIVRFSALILFLTSPHHDLHYTYTCWMRRYDWKLIKFLGNAWHWNANLHGQNMFLWEHHYLWYLRRLLCWLPSSNSIVC